MQQDFQIIREQVPIEQVAVYLLGPPVQGTMFRFPGERTASIKVYPDSRSFYDYGRGAGGDAVRLWSYIRQVNSWQALKEIKETFGVDTTPIDRQKLAEKIRLQKETDRRKKAEAKERRQQWIHEVEHLQLELRAIDNLLENEQPLSDSWCFYVNRRQMAEHQLDSLCGIEA